MKTSAYVLALLVADASANWNSTSTQKISIDQNKVDDVTQKVGTLINDVLNDTKTYEKEKKALDQAFVANVMTNWTKNTKKVEDDYVSAFNNFRNNLNFTQNGDWATIKVDNDDSVVKTFKKANHQDLQNRDSQIIDVAKYVRANKQLEKDTLNVTQWNKDALEVKHSVEDAIRSINVTSAFEKDTTSLYAASATTTPAGWQSTKKIQIDQEKVNKVGQEVGKLLTDVSNDTNNYNQKKQVIDKAFAANVMTNWTKEAKDVQDGYASAFDTFRKTVNYTQSNGWATVKFDDANGSVVNAFGQAVQKDMNTGKQWAQEVKQYDSDIKQLQK